MDIKILTAPDWADRLTVAQIKAVMEVKEEDDTYDSDIEELFGQVKSIGMPKAVIRECYIDSRSEGEIIIDGMSFRSKLVNEKIVVVGRVFAYVATCGREADNWSLQYASDPLLEFIASSIMKAMIPYAIEKVGDYLKIEKNIEKYSSLNPGSLPSWPVTGQRQVFGLIAGRENGNDIKYLNSLIGLELTESSLMVPLKSVSGIAFETDKEWHNCSRCRKKDCPGRRAPMDDDEAEDMIAEAGKVDMILI